MGCTQGNTIQMLKHKQQQLSEVIIMSKDGKKRKITVVSLELTTQGHQGDVFVQKSSLTQDDFAIFAKNSKKLMPAKIKQLEGYVTLVEGEGHHNHMVEADATEVYETTSDIDGIRKLIVNVLKQTSLQHFNILDGQLSNEHNTLVLEPGVYEVRSQRQLQTTNLDSELQSKIVPATD